MRRGKLIRSLLTGLCGIALLAAGCGDSGDDGDDTGNNAVNNDVNNDQNNDTNNDQNNDTDPCDDVACDAPAPSCDGNTAVTVTGGECVDGECQFEEERTDCGDDVCENGECVADDPCADIACDIPDPSCDGNTAVTVTGGDCVDGECQFEEERTDCGEETCVEGECVADDPCADIACDEPAPFCDENTAVISTGGECVDGECQFEEERIDCGEETCVDGACVADDPCEDVTCEAPATPFCDGNTAVTVNADGVCVEGECEFADTTEEDCGDEAVCTDGVCVAGDPCENVECPVLEPFCEGNSVITTNVEGACIEGECDYTAVQDRLDCGTATCIDGECVDQGPDIEPGDLVITEIMKAPRAIGNDLGQWFEIQNVSGGDIVLNGLVIENDNGTFTVEGADDIVVASNAFFVFGINDDPNTNGGVDVDLTWGEISLNSDADSISLNVGDTVIDSVEFNNESFPSDTGFAFQLDAALDQDLDTANDDGASWCNTTASYDNGVNYGTPGEPNLPCDDGGITIYQIQDIVAEGHPEVGATVTVNNVLVTVNVDGQLWIQEPEGGQFSGIYVEEGELDITGINIGDMVNVTGVYTENEGNFGIDGLSTIEAASIEVINAGLAIFAEDVAFEDIDEEPEQEAWESVLVALENAEVTDQNPDGDRDFGEFVVNDTIRVDDFLFEILPDPVNGATFEGLIGVVNFSFGNFKIEPRNAEDIIGFVQGDACAEVECPVLDPFCEGNSIITTNVEGVCIEGECDYTAVQDRQDCGELTCIGGECVDAGDGQLLISEVYYDSPGGDDGNEWIEIYNGTDAEIDLSTFSLGYGGGSYTNGVYQLAGTIPAGGCFVVGGLNSIPENGEPTFDQPEDFNPDMQNSGTRADAVGLFNVPASEITPETIPIDSVLYGTENQDGFLNSNGEVSAVDVGDAPGGSSIERVAIGQWQIQGAPSPNNCIVGN